MITCDQGDVNVTAEGCSPRRCQPFQSLTVRLGEYSVSASPLAIIAGGLKRMECRWVWRPAVVRSFDSAGTCHPAGPKSRVQVRNPLFRGTYIMYCNFGEAQRSMSACCSLPSPSSCLHIFFT